MRYLITGGSGYIGSRLVEVLAPREETERIVSVDVRPPATPTGGSELVRGDVRDANAMREVLERERIDALVHLAFILNPIHDEARMYDVDVNGTDAVLRAASAAGTGQVLVTSSATAYGAFPDNPKPIAEDWPVRGQPDFSYARHKADADRICQLWAASHPDRTMTIVRPSIVFGPGVDNYISRTWHTSSFLPIPDGVDQDFPAHSRGRRCERAHRPARREGWGRVQPRLRWHPHLARVRGDDRAADARHVDEGRAKDVRGRLGAARSAGRVAAGARARAGRRLKPALSA